MHESWSMGKPTLLLLSHCVPQATGSADRARAWQLLRLAAMSHRVHLVCRMDRPMDLAHWRLVNRYVERLTILPADPSAWWLQCLVGAPALKLLPGFGPAALTNLAGPDRFDALLCTHPMLWPRTRGLDARQRICDLSAAIGQPADPRLGPMRQWARRCWWAQQTQLRSHLQRECDLLLLSDTLQIPLARIPTAQTAILPEAVDAEAHIGRTKLPLLERHLPEPAMPASALALAA